MKALKSERNPTLHNQLPDHVPAKRKYYIDLAPTPFHRIVQAALEQPCQTLNWPTGPSLEMSQTNGLVNISSFHPSLPMLMLFLDQTCLLPYLAPHLSLRSTPCPLNYPSAPSSLFTSSQSTFTRPPRITDRDSPHGQAQTNL